MGTCVGECLECKMEESWEINKWTERLNKSQSSSAVEELKDLINQFTPPEGGGGEEADGICLIKVDFYEWVLDSVLWLCSAPLGAWTSDMTDSGG